MSDTTQVQALVQLAKEGPAAGERPEAFLRRFVVAGELALGEAEPLVGSEESAFELALGELAAARVEVPEIRVPPRPMGAAGREDLAARHAAEVAALEERRRAIVRTVSAGVAAAAAGIASGGGAAAVVPFLSVLAEVIEESAGQ